MPELASPGRFESHSQIRLTNEFGPETAVVCGPGFTARKRSRHKAALVRLVSPCAAFLFLPSVLITTDGPKSLLARQTSRSG